MNGEEDHNDNVPVRYPSIEDKVAVHPVPLDGIGQDKGMLLEIEDEDYTVVNILRDELITSRDVVFAGCKKPHPLENRMLLRVHVSGLPDENGAPHRPKDALVSACVRSEEIIQSLMDNIQ